MIELMNVDFQVVSNLCYEVVMRFSVILICLVNQLLQMALKIKTQRFVICQPSCADMRSVEQKLERESNVSTQ